MALQPLVKGADLFVQKRPVKYDLVPLGLVDLYHLVSLDLMDAAMLSLRHNKIMTGQTLKAPIDDCVSVVESFKMLLCTARSNNPRRWCVCEPSPHVLKLHHQPALV